MKKQFRIVENGKIWCAISIGIILIGLVFFIIYGFNLGIEFAGGVQLTVNVENITEENFADVRTTVKDALTEIGLNVSTDQRITVDGIIEGAMFGYKAEINGVKTDTAILEIVRIMYTQGGSELTDAQKTTLKEHLGEDFDFNGYASIESRLSAYGLVTLENETVSPSVSTKLFQNALLALGASLIGMGIYITIRFRTLGGFSSAISAVVALVHDVLIMLSFVLIAGVIWGLQINSTFVAAVVTIVAYSINNTIVLFDRIRENQKIGSFPNVATMVNKSVFDVLGRTIFTSLTTILAIVVLSIVGVPAIQEFTQPIFVGLVAGTYSSIFVVTPVWTLFALRKDKLLKVKK